MDNCSGVRVDSISFRRMNTKQPSVPVSRQLLGVVRRHRRVLGAITAGIGVLLALTSIRPALPATAPVLVTTTSLAAGAMVSPSDYVVEQWPLAIAEKLPSTSPDQIIGRPTTGPIAVGEPLTASRVVGPSLLAELTPGPNGRRHVAAPVRLADPGQADLIQAGDVIDIIAARAAESGGQRAMVIAVGAPVLSVPRPESTSASSGILSGGGSLSTGRSGLVIVAVDQTTATDLAAAATRSQLSIVIKPNAAAPSTQDEPTAMGAPTK